MWQATWQHLTGSVDSVESLHPAMKASLTMFAHFLQAYDSRLFGLGGSQSNRFVPLISADISATTNGKKPTSRQAARQNGVTPGHPPRPPTAPPQDAQANHTGHALPPSQQPYTIPEAVPKGRHGPIGPQRSRSAQYLHTFLLQFLKPKTCWVHCLITPLQNISDLDCQQVVTLAHLMCVLFLGMMDVMQAWCLPAAGQGLRAVALGPHRHQPMVWQQEGQCHRMAPRPRWLQAPPSPSPSLDCPKMGLGCPETMTSRVRTHSSQTACT